MVKRSRKFSGHGLFALVLARMTAVAICALWAVGVILKIQEFNYPTYSLSCLP